ncbi:hypothetical protein [Chryseobacterium sp. RLHN22]
MKNFGDLRSPKFQFRLFFDGFGGLCLPKPFILFPTDFSDFHR